MTKSKTLRSRLLAVTMAVAVLLATVTAASLFWEGLPTTYAQIQLTLTPAAWNAPASGGRQVVQIRSNSPWQMPRSTVNWLTISNITMAVGPSNGSFQINAAANTTGQTRTGFVTVTSGNVTRTVTVTQPGMPGVMPVLTLSPTTWNAPAQAGRQIIQVTSNTPWANNIRSNVNWLTISNIIRTTIGHNGSFQINATANTSLQPRTGTITVTGGGLTRTVTVTQMGAMPVNPVMTLSPSAWNAPTPGGRQTIQVTSNTQWANPRSTVNWLTVSNIVRSTAGHNGSFQINATANTTSQTRTGFVTVTAGNITRTVTVTQFPAQTQVQLTVTPTSWNPSMQAGSQVVQVRSNSTAWASNIRSNANWLTIQNISMVSAGDGSFRINVTSNPSTMPRTGTITVTAGNVTRTITVTQMGMLPVHTR